MSIANRKELLLRELASRIDAEAEGEVRQSLHNLSSAFFWRFQPEDLAQRSVDNLYACLNGLLAFMRQWPEDGPRVRIFTPEDDEQPWDRRYTTLVVLCQGIPFCTASVRGELNRRNLAIHTIVSSNLPTRRSAGGELIEVLPIEQEQNDAAALESLMLLEISRQSRPDELGELQDTLVDILEEVATVVRDFQAMSQRLRDVAKVIAKSDCVAPDKRDESIAFLHWLGDQHMILLGYEYLQVAAGDPFGRVTVVTERSLGLLRHLATRGVQDLELDLSRLSRQQLLDEQISFARSGKRSRVHRVAYPDYVEIREFDAAGTVIGQHRFLGLHTSGVYTMDPDMIPIVRRKVRDVQALSNLHWSEHESRELVRVLNGFPGLDRGIVCHGQRRECHSGATPDAAIRTRGCAQEVR